MTGQTTPIDGPECLEAGDEFLFGDRKIPLEVEAVGYVGLYNGSIYVVSIAIARGPQGAELWLQKTGTGRVRIKESAPWGAYANVENLRKVVPT